VLHLRTIDDRRRSRSGTPGWPEFDPLPAVLETRRENPPVTGIDVLFTAPPVADLTPAVDWYSRLGGRSPDVVVHDDEVMWRVVGPAWLYVLVDIDRAGHGLVTLGVADLATTIAELATRRLAEAPVAAVGTAGRRSISADPVGNAVTLVEATA
jgi:hypothetical protein